jgi:tannase/feruloyl esterase
MTWRRIHASHAWLLGGASALAVFAGSSASAAARCEDLTKASTPQRTIEKAEIVPAGAVQGQLGVVEGVPVVCKVTGFAASEPGSRIGFEVWLPTQGWNGRMQQIGNGGFGGGMNTTPLAQAVKAGYAASATDDGHTGSPIDGTWALNHPERIKDFAQRAVHETADATKAIIANYYGRPQEFAYFNGCSEGGREAFIAAQRYPKDYNGILAGAPALSWSRLMTNFIWNAQALHASDETYIPAGKLQAIQAAALGQCDKLDGLADGVISDPMACRFDPGVLLCKSAPTDACLTAPQIEGLRRVYAGPRDPATGKALSTGYEPGVEAEGGPFGWPGYNIGPARGMALSVFFGSGYYANFVFANPAWKFQDFDFARDPARAAEMGRLMDASDPDLSAFRAAGGKLIHYHGWGDASPPPRHSVEYHAAVQAKMGPTTDGFYKLYMAPGMLHCGMGPGPNAFGNLLDPAPAAAADRNVFEALRAWVETGKAPAAIVATKYVEDTPAKGVKMTRPLCPYPQTARWDGKGDATAAASFKCAAGKR